MDSRSHLNYPFTYMSNETHGKNDSGIITTTVLVVVVILIIIIVIIIVIIIIIICFYRGRNIEGGGNPRPRDQRIEGSENPLPQDRRIEGGENPGSRDQRIGDGNPGPQDQRIEGGGNPALWDLNDRENGGAIPIGDSSENAANQGKIEEGKQQEQGGFTSVNDNQGTIVSIQESTVATAHNTLILISESANSEGINLSENCSEEMSDHQEYVYYCNRSLLSLSMCQTMQKVPIQESSIHIPGSHSPIVFGNIVYKPKEISLENTLSVEVTQPEDLSSCALSTCISSEISGDYVDYLSTVCGMSQDLDSADIESTYMVGISNSLHMRSQTSMEEPNMDIIEYKSTQIEDAFMVPLTNEHISAERKILSSVFPAEPVSHLQSADFVESDQLSVSAEEVSLFEEGVEQYNDATSPAVPTFVTPSSGSLRDKLGRTPRKQNTRRSDNHPDQLNLSNHELSRDNCFIHTWSRGNDTTLSDKSTLDGFQIDSFSDISGVDVQPVQECYQGCPKVIAKSKTRDNSHKEIHNGTSITNNTSSIWKKGIDTTNSGNVCHIVIDKDTQELRIPLYSIGHACQNKLGTYNTQVSRENCYWRWGLRDSNNLESVIENPACICRLMLHSVLENNFSGIQACTPVELYS